MLAEPVATALTAPLALILATEGAELVQVTLRPVRTLPAESRSVAVACVLPPTTSDDDPSATDTLATGDGGGGTADESDGGVTPSQPMAFVLTTRLSMYRSSVTGAPVFQ